MNIRKEIILKVFDILNNNIYSNESTPIPVFINRALPHKTVPFIAISSMGDNAEKSADEQANRRVERVKMFIAVDGLETHEININSQSVRDKLDAIILQIEELLLSPYQDLDKLIYRFNYSLTNIETNIEAEKIYGFATMEFDAIYYEQL